MNKSYLLALFSILFIFSAPVAKAQQKTESKSLDQIVALVNDHIILKSEVNDRALGYLYRVQRQKKQRVPFSKKIWYTVLQNMVDNFVLLDQAQIDSVTVTDDKVNQQIDYRIKQEVQQVGSKHALEEQMGKSMVQIRADMYDQFKQQLTIQQYQIQKRQSIKITRPEVEEYFNGIPQDSLPTIPEKFALSQIVAVSPPKDKAVEQARHLAEQLRDSVLHHGKTIEEMARKYGDGPSSSNGGHLQSRDGGYMFNIDELVPEYSAAAAALKPGDISKVVRTSFGFHVIRLNKRQGDKIDTNQILIEVDQENYDKQAAIKKLNAIKDSLKNDDVTFADLARKKSEDPNTSAEGGRILNPKTGNRLRSISEFDPALYRIVVLLKEPGDISDPKPFTIGTDNEDSNNKKAYRIVRLDKHVPEHTANLHDDYEAIKGAALQEKQYDIMQKWIKGLKKNVYIEYKIPVPKQFASAQS